MSHKGTKAQRFRGTKAQRHKVFNHGHTRTDTDDTEERGQREGLNEGREEGKKVRVRAGRTEDGGRRVRREEGETLSRAT